MVISIAIPGRYRARLEQAAREAGVSLDTYVEGLVAVHARGLPVPVREPKEEDHGGEKTLA
jgi:hypothetical protein